MRTIVAICGEMQEMVEPTDYIQQVIKDICQMHRGGGIHVVLYLPRFVNEGEVTWEEDEGGLAAPARRRELH